jgi:hypothetical protein
VKKATVKTTENVGEIKDENEESDDQNGDQKQNVWFINTSQQNLGRVKMKTFNKINTPRILDQERLARDDW